METIAGIYLIAVVVIPAFIMAGSLVYGIIHDYKHPDPKKW